ncbi:MAG: cysteine synthase A [Bacteroidales bacterium]|nr:cysteine synthase A [Bacteroidales bacterium]
MENMKIKDSILELIGNTPLIEVREIEKKCGLEARLLVKPEGFNPGGSVKDRAALAMIEDAEKSGLLRPGATIIEPTSGNTGIGLAWIGREKGYNVILTMPETMSAERRQLLAAYGATVVLTPGADGMAGAIREAERLRSETPGAVILQQFDNPANPEIHRLTTAREIFRDTDGEVDMFVAGVGTGGTVSGTGRGLKELKPEVEIVAVEPARSPILSGGKPGPHRIQGIGANFVPKNFDRSVVDRIETVSDEDAIAATRMLAADEGIFAGISSGAALYVAIQEAKKSENRGKTIVVLLPDSGERYLSTGIFS